MPFHSFHKNSKTRLLKSGVKIFDIEAMSRIAHIDRPSGARCNLYPTISSLRPSIVFERSDSLLIGWGDCLMAMRIRELSTSSASTSKSNKDDSSSKQPKKKAVECTMAWELDCVACGLTPMDDKHVAVLGLLPSPLHSSSSMDDDGEVDESFLTGGDNILELQIINRVDGKSISSDKLPLLEQSNSLVMRKGGGIATANALEFSLLSSFAVPRMDDIAEWEALDDTEKESMRNELSTGSSTLPPGGTNDKFLDMHLRWNMDRDVCTTGFAQNNDNGSPVKETTESDDDNSIGSNCSICSDDYVFALSAPIEDIVSHPTTPLKSSPPTMVVLRSHDLCLVQTRDIDDVVSYSRSLGKPALALKQGLAHQREIRRHGLDHLVDEYFISLLRIGGSKIATTPRTKRALSFSRLKIAARTLPILLGGDTRMWQRWIFMFARIPGGLFLIREKIPVRGE